MSSSGRTGSEESKKSSSLPSRFEASDEEAAIEMISNSILGVKLSDNISKIKVRVEEDKNKIDEYFEEREENIEERDKLKKQLEEAEKLIKHLKESAEYISK